jgi:hypothetical protein
VDGGGHFLAVTFQATPHPEVSTITTTLDLYSHVTKTMQEDAAVKLDCAFRSAKGVITG